MMDETALRDMARLLAERARIDQRIADRIGHKAERGHIGEWIASQIFAIQLHPRANAATSDGVFKEGPLAGRNVNVNWYAEDTGIQDIGKGEQPDYYLALVGPRPGFLQSKSTPYAIAGVFLFESQSLLRELGGKVRVGTATSVRQDLWRQAQIYPDGPDAGIAVTSAQAKALRLFGY